MLSSHDQQEFTRLWTDTHTPVSHYVRSIVRDISVSSEIVQSTAMTLLRKFPEYDRSKPFLPWALSIARFEILSHRRDEARSRIAFDVELLDSYADQVSQLAPQISHQASALQNCLSKISGRSRRLVQLRYSEDRNASEISELLGMSPGNVRVALQRIREQLRQCIESQQGLEGRAVSCNRRLTNGSTIGSTTA